MIYNNKNMTMINRNRTIINKNKKNKDCFKKQSEEANLSNVILSHQKYANVLRVV
jgi:hypothetical protein